MKDEGESSSAFFHPSSFRLHPYAPHAAAGMGVLYWIVAPIAGQGGPLSARPLNHIAQNQTFDPGTTLSGKTTSTVLRVVLPSNFHPSAVAGGVGPTKLKMAAPRTPGGLPRLPSPAASCRRTFTFPPTTLTMSMAGTTPGGGAGVGAALTRTPSRSLSASLTAVFACTN